MDEQQMQFVDPEWKPPQSADALRNRVINLDPREQQESSGLSQREYTVETFHESDKLIPAKSRRLRLNFIVIPLVLLCLLVASIFAYFVHSEPRSVSQAFPTTGDSYTFTVHNYKPTDSGDNEPIVQITDDVGNVHVHIGGSRTTVTVQVTKHAKGGKFNGMTVAYDEGGPNNNTFTITANSDTTVSNSRSIDLDVTVPFGSSTQLSLGSGAVYVEGASADTTQASAQVNIGSGTVYISGVEGSIGVQAQSAQVTLLDLGGDISATTVSGSIHASKLSGAVTLQSSSSSIFASNVRWGATITTGDQGTITVKDATLTEQAVFATDAGAINYTGTLDITAQFKSRRGQINITLPANSAFHLDASSISGPITNDFGSNDVGGALRVTLEITTDSAAVHILRAKGQ